MCHVFNMCMHDGMLHDGMLHDGMLHDGTLNDAIKRRIDVRCKYEESP